MFHYWQLAKILYIIKKNSQPYYNKARYKIDDYRYTKRPCFMHHLSGKTHLSHWVYVILYEIWLCLDSKSNNARNYRVFGRPCYLNRCEIKKRPPQQNFRLSMFLQAQKACHFNKIFFSNSIKFKNRQPWGSLNIL